jgi:peptidoglycan/xylan/chitin deacetylase (PgdA/CDA1 family)
MEKELNELKTLVSAYEEFKNDGREFSPADFYTLMEHFGVEKEEFFTLLHEKNPDILSVLDNYTGERPLDEAPRNDAAEPPSAPPGSTMLKNSNQPLSEYTNLYLDLYVDRYGDELRYKDDRGYVYLTFDDGPSKHTSLILNYLRKHNVPATFFVIPGNSSSQLLNMILKDGHAIGVHTFSHDYYEIYSSVEAFLADFKKAYDLIYKQTGVKPEIFRFPGGSRNSYNNDVRKEIVAEMTRRGFVHFDWNVDSKDYADATWTQMYNTVLKEVAENTAKGYRSIILMHDRPGGMNTVLVLEDIIIRLLKDKNGYNFGKLDSSVRPIQF